MASVALLVSVPRASKYKPNKKNHKREIRQKTSRLLKSMEMPVMLIGYFTFKKKVFHSCGNRVCLEAVKALKRKDDAVGGRGNNRMIRKNEI